MNGKENLGYDSRVVDSNRSLPMKTLVGYELSGDIIIVLISASFQSDVLMYGQYLV